MSRNSIFPTKFAGLREVPIGVLVAAGEVDGGERGGRTLGVFHVPYVS
jgi:hypothetical protein